MSGELLVSNSSSDTWKVFGSDNAICDLRQRWSDWGEFSGV